ncbi:nuclease A inhibitor family protein [Leptolyngbya sp. KIOST-1]|uniref:nuclease A inhibitor family protein n=1 Tax=Leptolyngbya sp. KIOST-1 TaxID=1229172 RepID=UPI0005660243|nr:nuclease A inhibitor family protein [Leptolyngbya sp. KIOST-1]
MELQPHHSDFVACLTALEEAIAGLWYPSETDAPLAIAIYADPNLDATSLGQQLGSNADTYQHQPADAFFRPIFDNFYWSTPQGGQLTQRYRQLQEILQTHLEDLHLYRVGTVDVNLYLLGRHASGCHVGIYTHTVET